MADLKPDFISIGKLFDGVAVVNGNDYTSLNCLVQTNINQNNVKTLYLYSTAGGTVDLEILLDKVWYKLVVASAVTANTLWAYDTQKAMYALRLVFHATANGTINSWAYSG